MQSFHGQAASLPSQRPELRDLPSAGITICAKDRARCFRVFRKDNDYYISEFQPGPNDTELFEDTERIAYALGAPMAGTGYVIRRGDYLFEAPLSYYSGTQDIHPQGWGLSPGYEQDPLGFARPIVDSCLYCHVGRPRPVNDASNLYKNPPFEELTIGCESCHGPGELHVQEQRDHVRSSDEIDTSIVNPADLPPRLADDICTYCHEFAEARVPQPGKTFVDFRPGTPLFNTMAIFKSRIIMGWNMMEWFDEMTLSKCYRATGGRLSCISCHPAHSSLSTQEAPAFFKAKCLNCHQKKGCRLSLAERRRTTPPDNCIACHMPKHIAPRFVMLGTTGTSHRIVVSDGQPYPTLGTRQDSPDPATGLILVDRPPGTGRPIVSPLVLLVAYQSVLSRNPNRTDLVKRYDVLLNQLAKSDPDNSLVLSALAKRELGKRTPQGESAALHYLSRAVESGSKSPQDYMLLAELLFRSGQKLKAADVLKHAVSLFPYIPVAYENLSLCYISIGDNAKAEAIVRKGLDIFPSDPILLAVLHKIEALEGIP